ncbi:MAG: enoyl-CoA hydratase/isomerase family protein [Deltaproteobacteria bacterium]|nr:enoyl-CoA hydratase/isomerase family protein [Deltaproteobacteria bacterium]
MIVQVTRLEDARVLRVSLASPPRNVLDGATLSALEEALRAVDPAREPDGRLRVLLLTHEGPHFSYGASVAEHAPASAPVMLSRFFGVVRALAGVGLPVVAALRGQCLGAGLELVSLASRVFAQEDALLGQPEVRLAAFAPVAGVLLPRRIGPARAEELLLSGRVVGAREALALGLVDDVVRGDPEEAALAWIRASLLGHSAVALRAALRSSRVHLDRALAEELPAQEALYQQLLATADAEEGVRAFLEKRPPRWSDR